MLARPGHGVEGHAREQRAEHEKREDDKDQSAEAGDALIGGHGCKSRRCETAEMIGAGDDPLRTTETWQDPERANNWLRNSEPGLQSRQTTSRADCWRRAERGNSPWPGLSFEGWSPGSMLRRQRIGLPEQPWARSVRSSCPGGREYFGTLRALRASCSSMRVGPPNIIG